MAKNLIASAPTLDRLRQLIARYYCGPSVLILHDDGRIETGRGVLKTRWELAKGRYRFIASTEWLKGAAS
jgi:hypothetical protein